MSGGGGLTAAQHRTLKNLAEGRAVYHGVEGRSAHGGLHNTLMSLLRRGLIVGGHGRDPWVITPAGRAALGTPDAR